MAFCPNCGTPNTDQAEKCVACSFDFGPRQKAKFKGTIMMSGIKATPSLGTAETEPPPRPPPETTPAPVEASSRPEAVPTTSRNPTYQRTMLGHVAPQASQTSPSGSPAVVPPARPSMPPVSQPSLPGQTSFGTTTGTIVGAAGAPRFEPHEPATISHPGSRSGAQATPSYESTLPPGASRGPAPKTMLMVGGALGLGVLIVVGSLLYYALGPKIRRWMGGGEHDTEAAAWQTSITTSLSQVAALCQKNCKDANPYFHPAKQTALLGESKLLTSDRVGKLGDIATTKAEMLHRTTDASTATELGLDPHQCARVIAGTAKVISCSVPDAEGPNSVLRIVHLSGIGTL